MERLTTEIMSLKGDAAKILQRGNTKEAQWAAWVRGVYCLACRVSPGALAPPRAPAWTMLRARSTHACRRAYLYPLAHG